MLYSLQGMLSGWRYRVVSTGGTITTAVVALLVANHPIMQEFVTSYVPLISRLEPVVLPRTEFLVEIALTVAVLFVSLTPLYKPRPRRALDTLFLAQKRVIVALCVITTIGYFNWSTRLPRTTLFIAGIVLLVTVPVWFLVIRNRPSTKASRALVVGDNLDRIREVLAAGDLPVIGYLAPPIFAETETSEPAVMTDGGVLQRQIGNIDCLGGISRLEQVLIDYNINTVILAFENTDRGEFFGVLRVCHMHGVETKIMRDHADSVLLLEESTGALATIALEPWDWQDRIFKRGFDVLFAGFSLLIVAPLALIIALVIKIDSPGPVLYSQERTSWLGGTFQIYKFRTMVDDAEADTGAVVSAEDAGDVDPRVTRTGRILRKTHFDEIPQLWSILIGHMSVVGPRPERPALDEDIQASGVDWERRWFVKPGLTGLAQIHEVTGFEPEKKLQLDLDYIRRQSLWFDMKIILRQFETVFWDVQEILRSKIVGFGNRR